MTTSPPAKLELLARVANASSTLGLRDALDAWHRAGYGAVPGWALDVQIKRNPVTLTELRRALKGTP